LRFSPLVVNAGLWRADLLVREFLSADQISGGRVEIGLGAGTGVGPGPARPVGHLRETLVALRASLEGEANPPGWVSTPPILVGGSGDNLLRAAGELADVVGFAGPFPHPALQPGQIPLLSPAAALERIAVVREAAGERFDQIELNVGAEVHFTADRRATAEEAHRIHPYLSVEEILASPKFLAGTTEEIAEQLLGHRERFGLSYFATIGIKPSEFAPVIGALRGQTGP
jgi:alkanesulfonate monooxygenase SsuD/methylene tetrahydromethanopterin reductase-like flavin-dependent oxidoreductase (luciferase family)